MESVGFLQVAVKSANGALPIEDAQVSIYKYGKNEEFQNSDLIYSLVTNENGLTSKIALETKDKSLSLSPGNKNPYYVYNIYVSKDGYYDSSYLNVPIFQGITAIQPVELIPVLEYGKEGDDYPSSNQRFNETPEFDL